MDLIEKIKEAVARLAELTSDELNQLKTDIVKCGAQHDADTSDNTKVLSELAGYADAVKERTTAIEAEKVKEAEAARAARERIARLTDEDPDAPDADAPDADAGDGDQPDADADDADADADADTTDSPQAIAASAKKPLRANARTMRQHARTMASPELRGAQSRPTLVAAGQLVDHSFGDEFEDRQALAREMAMVLDGMSETTSHDRRLIARARWADLYPESRRLSGESTSADFRKIDAVCGLGQRRQSILASGGVPLPTNVDYSMDVWAVADRPVRDGLAAFHVDRGGLIYRKPPTLANLSTSATVWTNANDIDPTDPTTKPVYTVVAQDTTQEFISAIPTRLQFGNLMGQFDPETIAANTDLAIANAARVAELNLLTKIQGFAVDTITSAKVLGASRDLFGTLIQTAAAYRHTFRLNRDQRLTAIFPIWGLDLIKHDRLLEVGHDDNGTNVFAISDDEVNSWFDAYNVKVIWSLDGLAADAGGGTYDAQYFSAFTASEPVPSYPAEVLWNLFIEGSIQFLDGGRLDLGVVRDATLDATNDYETFVEPFEGAANRSFAGGVLQIVSTTHATGGTSLPVTVS